MHKQVSKYWKHMQLDTQMTIINMPLCKNELEQSNTKIPRQFFFAEHSIMIFVQV